MATITPTAQSRMLGRFLRAHREHTSPESVGLTPLGARRTPGLRREELASIAAVGLSWYTWLEQGRVIASRQVLDSVARALRLGPRSRRHMHRLAGLVAEPTTSGAEQAEHLSPLVHDWSRGPAFVLDRWFDIVAENTSFAAQWRGGLDSEETNFMRMLADLDGVDQVTGGGARRVLRAHLPHFRAQTAAHRHITRVAEIYESLEDTTPELADWWTCQEMDGDRTVEFDLMSPAGPVRMHQFMLQDEAGLTVVLQQPSMV